MIYTCLTERFKQRLGGSLEVQVAWDKIKEEVPGIHLLGYAEIPPPTRTGPEAVRIIVEAAGQQVCFDLVRQSFEELVYERGEGYAPGECRRQLTSWDQRAGLEVVAEADTDRSKLTIRPFEFEHRGFYEIPLSSIKRFALVRQWLVDDLRLVEE